MDGITRDWLWNKLKEFYMTTGREAKIMLVPRGVWLAMCRWSSNEWGDPILAYKVREGYKPPKLCGCKLYLEASAFALV